MVKFKATLRPRAARPSVVLPSSTMTAMEQQAQALEDAKAHDKAAKLWRQLTHLDADKFLYWSRLGRNLFQMRAFDKARPVLQHACRMKPNNRQAHLMLSAVLFHMGDDRSGRDVITSYFSRNPLSLADKNTHQHPAILRVNGVTGVRIIAGAGHPKGPLVHRRGGHFQIINLLPDTVAPRHQLTMSSSRPPEIDIPDDVGVILNTMADPDIEGQGLDGLRAFLKNNDIPVLNAPENVKTTTRDANFMRFGNIDELHFPTTWRFKIDHQRADELNAQITKRGIRSPYIVRITGTHKGRSSALVRTLDDLDKFLAANPGPAEIYAIQFVEARNAQGYFNKMRLFSIDGVLFPAACHIDQTWQVHGTNRLTLMKNAPWMMELEQAFMDDPQAVLGTTAMDTLKTMARQIDLDFFGFDFAMQKDGRPLIYELNPAMRHKYEYADNFPYIRAPLEHITDAFTAMVGDRLGIEASVPHEFKATRLTKTPDQ
ncbi:tetratricopeptide repeat protein [Pseudomonadota bacterium]